MLYRYGVGLGMRSLSRGHFTRETWKNVVIPVNYWRALEYRLVYDELDARASERILDLGSPKLLSLYMGKERAAKFLKHHGVDVGG